jgi:hypothetical protein
MELIIDMGIITKRQRLKLRRSCQEYSFCGVSAGIFGALPAVALILLALGIFENDRAMTFLLIPTATWNSLGTSKISSSIQR